MDRVLQAPAWGIDFGALFDPPARPSRGRFGCHELILSTRHPLEIGPLVRMVLRRVDAASSHDMGPDVALFEMRQGVNGIHDTERLLPALPAKPARRSQDLFMNGHFKTPRD